MPQITHIIWDWNGTLLDDTLACVNAINTMLEARGLPQLSVEQYRACFGFPVSDFYRKLGFVLEREDWDAMARDFHARFLADSSIALHSQTRPVLEQIHLSGVTQWILSASEQSILDLMLREYELSVYFKRAMGAQNLYGNSKVAIGRSMIAMTKVPRCEILLIGDSLHDYEVARDLDIACALIAQGHQSFDRLITCGVPVLRSLSEVPAFIGM
ncbi:MAG: HAD hydrolase-like protein [Kiritimatiellae bacterium]|nr:HAD hydrolase-like protein [Kiritimatiellia bacterium]